MPSNVKSASATVPLCGSVATRSNPLNPSDGPTGGSTTAGTSGGFGSTGAGAIFVSFHTFAA